MRAGSPLRAIRLRACRPCLRNRPAVPVKQGQAKLAQEQVVGVRRAQVLDQPVGANVNGPVQVLCDELRALNERLRAAVSHTLQRVEIGLDHGFAHHVPPLTTNWLSADGGRGPSLRLATSIAKATSPRRESRLSPA